MSNVTYEEMFAKVPYFGQNRSIQANLARVLTRLPEPVREFVLEGCIFTSSAEPLFAGIVRKAKVPKRALDSPHEFWLIVLSELFWSVGSDILKRKSLKSATKGQKERLKKAAKKEDERWYYIIAHEIAHAYLRHARMAPDQPEDPEAEADSLAAQWGFADPGATK